MNERVQEILKNATDVQRRFVVQRLAPGCIDAAKAARALKLNVSTPHKWPNLEELEEAVTLLQLEKVEAAAMVMQELALDAVDALKRALRGKSSVSAAKAILDRAGLPAQTNVDVTSKGQSLTPIAFVEIVTPDDGE